MFPFAETQVCILVFKLRSRYQPRQRLFCEVQSERGPRSSVVWVLLCLQQTVQFIPLTSYFPGSVSSTMMRNWVKMTCEVPFQIHLKKIEKCCVNFVMFIFCVSLCVDTYSVCVAVRGQLLSMWVPGSGLSASTCTPCHLSSLYYICFN